MFNSERYQDKVLLRPKEAAQVLAVSERKLWAMTFEEGLGVPHVKLGRSLRYPLPDLLAWIKTKQMGGLEEC